MTKQQLNMHSYIAELPLNMQQNIVKDLVGKGIAQEDLQYATRGRLIDLEDSIDIKTYLPQLNHSEVAVNEDLTNTFFISDKKNMNVSDLEDLTTILFVLNKKNLHYKIDIFHDVYEYGKYFMVMIHFYEEEPKLFYDDDLEEIVNDLSVEVNRKSVFFERSEVTFGLLNGKSFSFDFDKGVTHYLDVHQCEELNEHFIFAVHKYSDIEPQRLVEEMLETI